MKKRILSLILVLSFVLCAMPIAVTAEETAAEETTGVQTTIDNWSAKVGTISALENGVFKINGDNTFKGARQAMYNGDLLEGKVTITFDTASIMAKRSNLASNPGAGSNDTGIIFGGRGIKAVPSTTTNGSGVNVIEAKSQYYVLMFSNDTISINMVDKTYENPWRGVQKDKADNSSLSVNLATYYATMWTAAKDAGEVEVTLMFTSNGSAKVWLNGTHITQLDAAPGTLIPFGQELGVRAGMGFHVPTEIRKASIEALDGSSIDEWTGKVGSISALENGIFAVDAYNGGTCKVKHSHVATWNGSLPAGTIEVTFDMEAILAGRPDKVGVNNVGIIFGGEGIKDFVPFSATNNNMNNDSQNRGMEQCTSHYFLFFNIGETAIGTTSGKGSVVISDVSNGGFSQGPLRSWSASTDNFKSVWDNAKEAGKITVKITFTETGSLRVYMDGTLISGLSKENAVPYGSDVAIRTGMGWDTSAKVLDAKITSTHTEHTRLTRKVDDFAHWDECYCGEFVNFAAHTLVDNTAEKAADCTETGTKATKKCSGCDTVFYYNDAKEMDVINTSEDQLVIPATGHVNVSVKSDASGHWTECACGEITVAKAAHDIAEDALEGTCSICGYEKIHTCTPAQHFEAIAADCLNEGNIEYWVCACGNKYSDEACTELVTDVKTEKDLNKHVGEPEVKFDEEGHWTVCECGATIVEKVAHELAGGDEGKCSGCDYSVAHVCDDFTVNSGKIATCLEEGEKAHKICNDCGKIYVDGIDGAVEKEDLVIPVDKVNGHVIDAREAEWITDGKKHWKACECGDVLEEGDHDGTVCSVCGALKTGLYEEVNGNYYFLEWNNKLLEGKFYVTESSANGLLGGEGWYYAYEGGKIIMDDFFTDENGVIRYIVRGQVAPSGAVEVNGKVYVIDWDGVVRTGKIYVTAESAGTLLTEGWYYTNNDGSMKTGFVTDNGVTRYVVDGKVAKSGATLIDDGVYVIGDNGEVRKGKIYVTAESAGTVLGGAGWYYTNDKTGKVAENGFYTDENGTLIYIEGGKGKYERVHKVGDNYYMIEWDGRVVISVDKFFYITADSTKGQIKAGWYKTNSDGSLIMD